MAILSSTMEGAFPRRSPIAVPALAVLLAGVLLAGTAKAAPTGEAEARVLINALGCKGCHRLEGQGGAMGAPLEEIAAKLDRSQLRRALVDSGEHGASSPMPAYRHLADGDIALLVDFLAGLR